MTEGFEVPDGSWRRWKESPLIQVTKVCAGQFETRPTLIGERINRLTGQSYLIMMAFLSRADDLLSPLLIDQSDFRTEGVSGRQDEPIPFPA